jgi:arginase
MKILNKPISLIDAPSNLGLKPPMAGKEPGVYRMPQALRAAGIMSGLQAIAGGLVIPPPYVPDIDPTIKVRNAQSIRRFSLLLAQEIKKTINDKYFPLVLGGDCSILLGSMLALKRMGEYGLFFIDGHRDFLLPSQSQTGGAAGMDLALVTGRGPEELTNIEGQKPFVQDSNVVVFGFRDVEDPNLDPYREIFQTQMVLYSLSSIREIGLAETVSRGIARLKANGIKGFWIHLDADVLDDEIMPAVDSPQIGGLTFKELSELLRLVLNSELAVGMEITIFDPEQDKDGKIARAFTNAIIDGFST